MEIATQITTAPTTKPIIIGRFDRDDDGDGDGGIISSVHVLLLGRQPSNGFPSYLYVKPH